jgi:GNAT superfamily N-acetyltransferase
MRTSGNAVRACCTEDEAAILAIINAAAERYRGVIPTDCWHDPYMSRPELGDAICAGVRFWGCEDTAGQLLAVMGIQPVKDVTLVRHAYVRPEFQGTGLGGVLLRHLETLTDQRILIGTWAAATWAIRFYEKHGYSLIAQEEVPDLLRTYWDISERQAETSVVLSKAARTEHS